MNKPGAGATVMFTRPGTYVLGTKPGEDYTKGIVTTGADNVLRMTVRSGGSWCPGAGEGAVLVIGIEDGRLPRLVVQRRRLCR